MQKHHASSLHWDPRLEMAGVLASWAVPKGPSPDPADKRLAMHVEPHPLEYVEFEGVIPEGQYGAGPSTCWDKGVWIEIPGDKHGIEHGKLLFELRGYKLRGRWTLVHTPKRGGNHWLLIKERERHHGYVPRHSPRGARSPGRVLCLRSPGVRWARSSRSPVARSQSTPS